MPKIDTLTLGAYQTNCYIVRAEGASTCAIVDPGYEPEAVLAYCRTLGLTPEVILLTHGHFDHVGGVKEIRKATDCRVCLCAEDLRLPIGLTGGPLEPTDLIEDGDTILAAGLSFTVLQTPGHTAGSCCYVTEGAMFAGDTLFQGACGRVDLPTGSWGDMMSSLKRLYETDYEGPVYPGHGSKTNMASERRWNPYMQEAVKR